MGVELKWSNEEKKFMALHLKLGIITYENTPEEAMIQMDSIVLFDKIKETPTERFNRITSQLDAISKRGWELSDSKLDKMTADIMESLGYEKRDKV